MTDHHPGPRGADGHRPADTGARFPPTAGTGHPQWAPAGPPLPGADDAGVDTAEPGRTLPAEQPVAVGGALSRQEERARPLYSRLLGLRHVDPGGVLCFVFFEGALVLASLLALAELVDWWAVVTLPVAVAVMVKLNDEVAAAIARSAARVPQLERDRMRREMTPFVGRAAVPRAAGVTAGPLPGERTEPTGSHPCAYPPADHLGTAPPVVRSGGTPSTGPTAGGRPAAGGPAVGRCNVPAPHGVHPGGGSPPGKAVPPVVGVRQSPWRPGGFPRSGADRGPASDPAGGPGAAHVDRSGPAAGIRPRQRNVNDSPTVWSAPRPATRWATAALGRVESRWRQARQAARHRYGDQG
jgi:hypothetical protein